MWKIYKGYKKSTKQEAAIFLFEKKQLDKWDKQDREQTLEKMRKGISQLTRLRHPQVSCLFSNKLNRFILNFQILGLDSTTSIRGI